MSNYIETLADLPESEYPIIEDGTLKSIFMMSDTENKFSQVNIKLGFKEIGFFSDLPQVSTHVNGFRYPLIEKCKIENVGDLRFVEGNPPPAACCAKLNIIWVITRRSTYSFCSTQKVVNDCKFEIKLLRRNITEKCIMENKYLEKVQAANLEKELQKAKENLKEENDKNSPWKNPLDEKKEMDKLMEKEKQKQAEAQAKELLEAEKGMGLNKYLYWIIV